MGNSDSNAPDDTRSPLLAVVAAGLLVVAAGLTAYYNSFRGTFLFDDRLHILGERRLHALWPLWEVLSRKRPVVDYSLAINHALGGNEVAGYHAVNVTIHLLAALTLLGVVRRTLLLDGVRHAFGRSITPLAASIALIWVVHPLCTQSVTYLVQRAESLMALFYLLTLYCFVRGSAAKGSLCWHVAAVLCCALGMGSKGVMVTCPVVILFYDRVFLAASFRDLLRRRWGLHLALAATWAVLWHNGLLRGVLNPSNTAAHVGFGYRGIAPIEYAVTQLGVLMVYLRLSWWPQPLCLDYSWPVAEAFPTVVLPAVALAAATFLLIRCCGRSAKRWFPVAAFFLILAPTSSVIPIRDPLFEHRMYLPLALLVVSLVLGGWWWLRVVGSKLSLTPFASRTLGALAVGALIVVMARGTAARNALYASEPAMWLDVLTKRPNSARAAENYGTSLLAVNRLDEALTALEKAVEMNPNSADAQNGLGFAQVAHGLDAAALDSFAAAVRLQPGHPRARVNLGKALAEGDRLDEAIQQFQAALRYRPRDSRARLELGNALLQRGSTEEAISQFRSLVDIDPKYARGWGNLGAALLSVGRFDEAHAALTSALAIDPDMERARGNLGISLVAQERFDEAVTAFRDALRLEPDSSGTHANLGRCLYRMGDLEGAVGHFEQAVRLDPQNASSFYELGVSFLSLSRNAEAVSALRRALQLEPGHPQAQAALRRAMVDSGSGPP